MKTFEKFLFEKHNYDIIFYIDMDGVLSDFDGKIEKSPAGYEHDEIMGIISDWMKEHHPEIEWAVLHDIKKMCESEPELKDLYKRADYIVKHEAKKEGFFASLKVLPGAIEMLELANELAGKLPTILTACVDSSYCEHEKKIWLEKNLAGLYGKVIYEQDKEIYAKGKNDILIDDRATNVKLFRRAGGTAIHHHPKKVEKTLTEMKKLAHNTVTEKRVYNFDKFVSSDK